MPGEYQLETRPTRFLSQVYFAEPLDVVLDQADLLIIGAPHRAYWSLAPQVPVFDIWNVVPRTVST